MEPELKTLIVEFVEKVGLLKRDMKQKPEFERYEARFLRIEQKFSALAESIATTDPDFAKTLRRAWQMPATSLAFRNAEHQKKLKDAGTLDQGPGTDQGLRTDQEPSTKD